MVKMSPDEFIHFLHIKLKERFKLTDENAEYLSETLINGHKKVNNGQYATTVDKGLIKNFIRKDNRWVIDDTLDNNDVVRGAEDLACELNNNCIAVSGEMDKCESIELNKSEIKEKMIKSAINEFDEKSYDSDNTKVLLYKNNLLISYIYYDSSGTLNKMETASAVSLMISLMLNL
jgi:hypothetical protein